MAKGKDVMEEKKKANNEQANQEVKEQVIPDEKDKNTSDIELQVSELQKQNAELVDLLKRKQKI